MKKTKFYVVWVGQKPGIYDNWDECKKQISGFHQAIYKSFDSRQEADIAFKDDYTKYFGNNKSEQKAINNQLLFNIEPFIKESISTDAACSSNPGPMEYRIVNTSDGKELYHSPVYLDCTVNIGEFLAIVHALAMLHKKKSSLPVYSDSSIAIKWVKAKRVNTRLIKTESNAIIFDLIDRALFWLQNNTWQNQLLKWNTLAWGEIPADFGRK